jgi:hypothetical protein
MVAMYTDNPDDDAEDFAVGPTLCITSARPHHFLDGQTGFRIDDPGTFEVCPLQSNQTGILKQPAIT